MRPIHANKRSKRYRYYVSPALVESSIEVGAMGWRISAASIEAALARAIGAELANPVKRSAIVAQVKQPERIASALDRLIARLQDPTSADGKMALIEVTRRVNLTETQLEATINLAAILGHDDAFEETEDGSISVSAPVRIDRRGASVRLALRGAAGEPTAPDPQLVRTVITARRRLAAYTNQEDPKSLIEIAEVEGAHLSDVSRSLQLAFLAPDLLEAILDGRQPIGLTATRLLRLDMLPLLWDEQRATLS